MKYVPIAIPTLNRYSHLKDEIESLSKCTLCDQTDIYISLDYPPNSSYVEGWKKIHTYLSEDSNFKMFRNHYIYFQSNNLGAYENLCFILKKALEYNDWCIPCEDDIIFSSNSLLWYNKMIGAIGHDDRVIGVCGDNHGYNEKKEIVKYPCKTFQYGFSGLMTYVCAMSKSNYEHIVCSCNNKIEGYANSFLSMIRLWNYDQRMFCDYIVCVLLHKNDVAYTNHRLYPIDLVINVFAFFNHMLFVIPNKPKVKNTGFDGSGIHMQKDAQRANIAIDDDKDYDFTYDEFKLNEFDYSKCYVNAGNNHVKLPNLLYAWLLYLGYRIGIVKPIR